MAASNAALGALTMLGVSAMGATTGITRERMKESAQGHDQNTSMRRTAAACGCCLMASPPCSSSTCSSASPSSSALLLGRGRSDSLRLDVWSEAMASGGWLRHGAASGTRAGGSGWSSVRRSSAVCSIAPDLPFAFLPSLSVSPSTHTHTRTFPPSPLLPFSSPRGLRGPLRSPRGAGDRGQRARGWGWGALDRSRVHYVILLVRGRLGEREEAAAGGRHDEKSTGEIEPFIDMFGGWGEGWGGRQHAAGGAVM
eukprot:scaffold267603_cov41-Tisochrysis_lutea.AAC.1